MKDYIGAYVKHFESGTVGSLALGSSGYDWGLSCGSFQLTLRWGNCINFLKKYFPQESKGLYYTAPKDVVSKIWPGADYCSSPQEVKQIWINCYNKVGEEIFFNYEHQYIKSKYYDLICTKLMPIIDISNSSRAFKECFWSWSIARGVGGCRNEFMEIVDKIDINTIEAEDLFDLIYDKRYEKCSFDRYKKGNPKGEREILRPLLDIKIEATTEGNNTMKYSNGAIPLICMMTNSTCYQNTSTMEIKGILWHSTGCNNPTLKRYVQPSEDDPNYIQLMEILGDNIYNNDINHIVRNGGGLNAWIGKLQDGTVTTVQTMPWNYRPWGVGSGKFGSCNDNFIQFEICEDNLNDPIYFNQVYEEACQLTAYLCAKYNIDPYGSVLYNGIKVPTILCHADASALGLGINHEDIYHWFLKKYNKDMNNIRNDVAKLLNNSNIQIKEKQEEEEDMTQERFNELMNGYLQGLALEAGNSWSKEALNWAQNSGLMVGDYQNNLMPKKTLTREEFIVVMKRFYDNFVKE